MTSIPVSGQPPAASRCQDISLYENEYPDPDKPTFRHTITILYLYLYRLIKKNILASGGCPDTGIEVTLLYAFILQEI